MQLINAACATLPYSCAAMKQKATKTVKTRKVRRMEFLSCRVAIRRYKLDSVQDHCVSLQCQYVMENNNAYLCVRYNRRHCAIVETLTVPQIYNKMFTMYKTSEARHSVREDASLSFSSHSFLPTPVTSSP